MRLKYRFLSFITLIALSLYLTSCDPFAQVRKNQQEEAKKTIRTLSEGGWAWEDKSCDEYYQTFTFDLENKKLFIQTIEALEEDNTMDTTHTEYDILSYRADGFKARIVDEMRLDDEGNPVIWNLVLSDENTYHWRREDWSFLASTKSLIKCLN